MSGLEIGSGLKERNSSTKGLSIMRYFLILMKDHLDNFRKNIFFQKKKTLFYRKIMMKTLILQIKNSTHCFFIFIIKKIIYFLIKKEPRNFIVCQKTSKIGMAIGGN